MGRLYGLIGYPLSHSWSSDIFRELFHRHRIENSGYELFEISSPGSIYDLIENNPELHGLNVTIPFKKEIIQYLDFLDESASKAGAVNCISLERRHGKRYLSGYNTDYPAFKKTLGELGFKNLDGALVLGTGGASGAVAAALVDLGMEFRRVSRSKGKGDLTYGDLKEKTVKDFPLIINTTPAGMYPLVGQYPPFPFHFLTNENFCYDLVYNPPETPFMLKAAECGATVKNGEEMLWLQAELSLRIWLGKGREE